jgi:hypothetical protein
MFRKLQQFVRLFSQSARLMVGVPVRQLRGANGPQPSGRASHELRDVFPRAPGGAIWPGQVQYAVLLTRRLEATRRELERVVQSSGLPAVSLTIASPIKVRHRQAMTYSAGALLLPVRPISPVAKNCAKPPNTETPRQ